MKPVHSLEGQYLISTDGRCFSIRRQVLTRQGLRWIGGRYVNTHKNPVSGYVVFQPRIKCKSRDYLVHRLLAQAFIPNPLGLPIINHKNGIRDDNRLENLEWCTYQQNIQHGVDMGHFAVQHSPEHLKRMRRSLERLASKD